MKETARAAWRKITYGFTVKGVIMMAVGAMICTFGIHNIHARSLISEGGAMGLMLLVEHWTGLSPAYITPVLDILCYLFAFKHLGGNFIKISAVSTLFTSAFYKVWELFPYMTPDFSDRPLAAALLGGIFVGVGVGIIVRFGGSSSGDDALAITVSHITKWRLSVSYMLFDFSVLGLSLTYIPLRRIVYSVVTVTLSSWLVDFVKNFKIKKESLDKEG